MSPDTERLLGLLRAAEAQPHGARGALYAAAAEELGLSLPTLHRRLRALRRNRSLRTERRRRSDAGETALTREEAMLLSGVLMESIRGNGKRLYAVGDALAALRANGLVRAERVDAATGEVVALSESAVHRALRGYGLHPDQLLRPAPAAELASRHPNHVWQIDASLCVLYYLRPSAGGGLQVMEADKYYKNKPAHVARIAHERVWSYEITDHASGWIYVEYVLGAESGENLCSVLINAMQERGRNDVLHGVPRILYMDPGSANTSAMALNLCRALGIEAIAHAPGNARATGQVENARNIIERKFESGLKFRPVADLAELNALAAQWRTLFNATGVHRRHGMTRSAAWMRITADQLLKAPPVAVCRELAVAAPVERKVSPKLRVSFGGDEYNVATVPGVLVGERVLITRNPWRDDAAQVVQIGADGRETYHVVARIERDEFGFAASAAEIGASYRRPPDTQAQRDRAEIEQRMTGTASADEAAAERKRKAIPLGGSFNPYVAAEQVELPAYLPRRGSEHGLTPPRVEIPPLSHVAAAKLLRAQLGERWTAESMARLKREWPNGVPEADLDRAAELLGRTAPALRVVGGDA
jgi:transposase InsO family protein